MKWLQSGNEVVAVWSCSGCGVVMKWLPKTWSCKRVVIKSLSKSWRHSLRLNFQSVEALARKHV